MVLTHYRKMHPYIFRYWVFIELLNKLTFINISNEICNGISTPAFTNTHGNKIERGILTLITCLKNTNSNGQILSYNKLIKAIVKLIESACFTLDISFLYLVSRLFCLCCFSKPSFNIYPTLIKTYYNHAHIDSMSV